MSDCVELYIFGAKIVESERSQRVGTHVRSGCPYKNKVRTVRPFLMIPLYNVRMKNTTPFLKTNSDICQKSSIHAV